MRGNKMKVMVSYGRDHRDIRPENWKYIEVVVNKLDEIGKYLREKLGLLSNDIGEYTYTKDRGSLIHTLSMKEDGRTLIEYRCLILTE